MEKEQFKEKIGEDKRSLNKLLRKEDLMLKLNKSLRKGSTGHALGNYHVKMIPEN